MTGKRTGQDIALGCVGSALVLVFAIFWGAVFVIVVIEALNLFGEWAR